MPPEVYLLRRIGADPEADAGRERRHEAGEVSDVARRKTITTTTSIFDLDMFSVAFLPRVSNLGLSTAKTLNRIQRS